MGKTLVFCYLVLLSIFGFSQEKYPQLDQIVTDNAGIFTSGQLEDLRAKLTQFETETTNQLVILTINDLEGVSIEEYANVVFNQNKLGQAGKDNGILILFSKNDREVRIEVGYGLEPYITDAVASRIIRNTMIPKFKEEDYFGGLDNASDQLIELLKNPDALAEFNKEMEAENELPWWGYALLMVFLSFFMVPGGFVFYKGYSSLIEMFRGIMIGKLGLFPGVFMIFAGLMQVFFGLIFIGVPLFFLATIMGITFDEEVLFGSIGWVIYGIIGFFLLTILLAIIKIQIKGKEDFKLSWFKSDKTYMSKTFSSSGTHSFGSSSGGSSSSFSGGGGSSGGGGASGSW